AIVKSVLLPEPEVPTSAVTSPSASSRSIPFKIFSSFLPILNDFSNSLICSDDILCTSLVDCFHRFHFTDLNSGQCCADESNDEEPCSHDSRSFKCQLIRHALRQYQC